LNSCTTSRKTPTKPVASSNRRVDNRIALTPQRNVDMRAQEPFHVGPFSLRVAMLGCFKQSMMLGDESYAANPAADSVVFFGISSPLQPAQPCPITMYEPARTMVRHEPTGPTGNGSSGLAVFRLGPTRLRQRRMLQVNMFILQREPACLGSRFIIQGRSQLCLPKTYPWKLSSKPATFKKSKPRLCRRVDRQVTMLHSVQDPVNGVSGATVDGPS
jgi:hypothetical protein